MYLKLQIVHFKGLSVLFLLCYNQNSLFHQTFNTDCNIFAGFIFCISQINFFLQ